MKMDNRRLSQLIILILFWLPMLPFFGYGQEERPERITDSLEYFEEVVIQTIPFYAVDRQGKPVFDLKPEELSLYLNGKKVDYLGMFNFSAPTLQNVKRGTAASEQKLSEPKSMILSKAGQNGTMQKRYVFVILDKMFNSRKGIRKSRELIEKLIRRSSDRDLFILYQIDSFKGLSYLAGPTADKEKCIRLVRRIRAQGKVEYAINNIQANILAGRIVDKKTGGEEFKNALKAANAEMKRYVDRGKTHQEVIASLKYVLKTITRPKLVYLVSEGINFYHSFGRVALGARKGDRDLYYEQLKKTAEAVNQGGSMLFVMDSNPVPNTSTLMDSGTKTLKYLAENSGGRYYWGRDQEAVIQKLHNTTKAYYEIDFDQDVISGNKSRVKVNVKCLRKGVTLHTLNRTEFKVKYQQMEAVQQELFALDIVNGGVWGRLLGKISETKPLFAGQQDKGERTVEFLLPEAMKHKTLDIFQISIDPKTFRADVQRWKSQTGEKLVLTVPRLKHRSQFIVFIEPGKTICRFSPI